jgi:hypothetical protein
MMLVRTFEAVSYLDAVRRARTQGLFGEIQRVGRNLWICWAN